MGYPKPSQNAHVPTVLAKNRPKQRKYQPPASRQSTISSGSIRVLPKGEPNISPRFIYSAEIHSNCIGRAVLKEVRDHIDATNLSSTRPLQTFPESNTRGLSVQADERNGSPTTISNSLAYYINSSRWRPTSTIVRINTFFCSLLEQNSQWEPQQRNPIKSGDSVCAFE